jgi:hypothetical protein
VNSSLTFSSNVTNLKKEDRHLMGRENVKGGQTAKDISFTFPKRERERELGRMEENGGASKQERERDRWEK